LALPRTPLHERLAREGRLKPRAGDLHQLWNNLIATNVVPLRMTEQELMDGFRRLLARIADDAAIERRILNKARYLGQIPRHFGLPPVRSLLYLTRLLVRGVVLVGPRRWLHFVRSLRPALRKPRLLPFLVLNWTYGLAVQAFVRQHLRFMTETTEASEGQGRVGSAARVLYSVVRPSGSSVQCKPRSSLP
jgi:Domain of unknown function (DUF4070)